LGGNKKNRLAMNLKRVIKSLVPAGLRKRLFLAYNRLKIKTWDRLFFPSYPMSLQQYKLNHSKNPFTELDIPVTHLPAAVQNGLKIWQDPDWSMDEYIIQFDAPGFIEPRVGWGLTTDRLLIRQSLALGAADHVHKPSTLETYFRKKDILELDRVISLRDTGEENYFHFFNDILSKLFLLKDHGYSLGSYTLVVSERLYEKSYFRYYLRNTWLGSLNWHVQRNEWIRFRQAIFCKAYTHTRNFLARAVDMLPAISEEKPRRVFLTRGKTTGRFISNMDELAPVLTSFNFEIIDPATLQFEQQLQVFSNTSHLIGIHGAGMTNMIFAKNKPLAVLELLHPFQYVPFHYIMMAKIFDFRYDAIYGKPRGDGGFVIDAASVRNYLDKNFRQE
jgi:capsular polysaccharide biosynthesis protein